jgi:hypothetical protein
MGATLRINALLLRMGMGATHGPYDAAFQSFDKYVTELELVLDNLTRVRP